jgi:hypothetical protein
MSTSHADRKLKAVTAALLRASGAVTFVEVKLRTRARREATAPVTVTDIDVFGVQVSQDLRVTRTVAECKSGARDVVADVYKLAGVIASQRAHQGMLVRTTVGPHVREVARTLGIWVADPSELDHLLQHWLPDPKVAAAAEEHVVEVTTQLSAEAARAHPGETSFLVHDHWGLSDAKAIVSIVRAAGNIGGTVVLERPESMLLCTALLAFAIRVLNLAGDVMRYHSGNPGLGVRLQLAGGMQQLRERDLLVTRIREAIPENEAARVSGEPPYVQELTELVFRLIRAAPLAAQCPRVLERFARWSLEGSDDSLPELAHRLQGTEPTTMKLAQDFAVALRSWGNIEGTPFRHLLAL